MTLSADQEPCVYVIGNSNDFMIIMMGCGVGYFLIGYFIGQLLCRERREAEPAVLLANQV